MPASRSIVFLLLMTLPGCFLFRKAAEERLFEIISLPGGVFQMGDVFEHENEDAIPVHDVTIAPFDLGTYEITYAQYDFFALETGRPLPSDDDYGRGQRAVVNVKWDDALAFCRHHGFRLPTEAEWEYAARSGGLNERFAGTDSLKAADRYVRHLENSVLHAFQVGTKSPNALGLYDMSGNVYEWIGDYYEFYPKNGEEPGYKDLEASAMRIIRGGSFKHGVMFAQTFWRSGTLADIPSNAIGFRCARSAHP
jgi:formylglycine-generating enzyme required for sulfatase activity